MRLIIGTFLFSVASALVPILNAEAYLAVVAAKAHDITDWQVALMGAAGQTVGKIIWYYAGWHSLKLSWMKKKMESEGWRANYERWKARISGRPVLAGGITFASAVSGFPPLAVIAVVAGTLRMNLAVFILTVVVGRTIRFWAVLAGVGLIFAN